MKITTSDAIRLPYLRNELDSNLNFVSLLSTPDQLEPILANEIARVKVENHSIIIDPLPVGLYKLVIRDLGEAIRI